MIANQPGQGLDPVVAVGPRFGAEMHVDGPSSFVGMSVGRSWSVYSTDRVWVSQTTIDQMLLTGTFGGTRSR